MDDSLMTEADIARIAALYMDYDNNCAVLPWGLSENRKYDQRRGIFRLLGTIFLQEYFAYCKKKWCPAGGKGPLFGRVDGFQIDPNTSECTNLRKTKLQRT